MAKKPKFEELESSNGVAVRFTVSPVGPYGLGYFAGDVAEIDALLAAEIVTNGHGEYVEPVADEPVADEPVADEVTNETTETTVEE